MYKHNNNYYYYSDNPLTSRRTDEGKNVGDIAGISENIMFLSSLLSSSIVRLKNFTLQSQLVHCLIFVLAVSRQRVTSRQLDGCELVDDSSD